MQLLTVGLSHASAPVALRERVSFPAGRVHEALADLRHRFGSAMPESAILSTCNRTEVYCAVREPAAAAGTLVDWLAEGSALPSGELRSHIYALPQHDAVRHAFRVASGLDSMVLGEPQILGQMKKAARQAQQAGALGAHLHQLFQRTFAVAKEVRSRTEIGCAPVSLAAAAVRLAQRVFDDLRDARVLIIGAGEMAEFAALRFAAHHPRDLAIANRSVERGERLAERLSARFMLLAEVPERLRDFDVVVAGVASPLPIVGPEMVERACRARRRRGQRRALVMIDLAVPRNIEPAVAGLPDVLLHSVDDLGRVARAGTESRQAAVAQAEAIIENKVEAFMRWMDARRSVPLLRTLEERARSLRAAELRRARRLLACGERLDTVLEALALGLSNKFLHAPRALLGSGTLPHGQAQRLIEQWLPDELPQRCGATASDSCPPVSFGERGPNEEDTA